jgi:hypothetical protein
MRHPRVSDGSPFQLLCRAWSLTGRIAEGSGHFYRGNVTFVPFQFKVRFLFVGMVRSPAAFQTEPFLSCRIPSNIFVFHRVLSHPDKLRDITLWHGLPPQ